MTLATESAADVRTGSATAIAFYSAAVILGVLIGYVDIATGEVFITALLLLSLGMVFGVWRARRGWLAGIVLALGVTAYRIVAHLLYPMPHVGDIPASLLAMLPAVVGGAGGGLMRIAWQHLNEPESDPRHDDPGPPR